MGRKPEPIEAKPPPRNVQRQRYQGLEACWTINVMLHENGEVSACLGKLDKASRWMRFTTLADGLWEGSVTAEAARCLTKAADEVFMDTSAQLRLF